MPTEFLEATQLRRPFFEPTSNFESSENGERKLPVSLKVFRSSRSDLYVSLLQKFGQHVGAKECNRHQCAQMNERDRIEQSTSSPVGPR